MPFLVAPRPALWLVSIHAKGIKMKIKRMTLLTLTAAVLHTGVSPIADAKDKLPDKATVEKCIAKVEEDKALTEKQKKVSIGSCRSRGSPYGYY
jgi:hypothetical protein